MSWISSSLLMFFSSIAFYLSVKKLQVLGVDKRLYTVANNFFPLIIFFLISLKENMSLILSFPIIVALLFARVGFNYIGTIMGYKGMEQAPNAGYSLVVQKSYAVYTLFASALLFGSELPLHKVLISMLVLLGGIIVALGGDEKTKKVKGRWALYSIVALFSFGTISLSSKYFAGLGVAPISQLFWTMLMTLVLSMIDTVRIKKSVDFKMNFEKLIYMVGLGLFASSFYYFKLISEIAAPNVGYVGAINAASNAFYVVVVTVVFKDSLSLKNFFAIIGIALGLVALLFF